MRRSLLVTSAALAASAVLLPAAPARADVADVWTTYASISDCQADLISLNDYCFGLQDGQAIGLIDAALTVDEIDQAAGIAYDDENVLPAPESSSNPVVEVWNNTGDPLFLGPGASLADDAASDSIYVIPPGEDLTGPAIDADAVDISWTAHKTSTWEYFITTPGLNSDAPITDYGS